ncbi:MAG: cation transporter [Gammaproteobacteria bacterium]|nr:cation transporter [Gammaproteobacteria bacterium]
MPTSHHHHGPVLNHHRHSVTHDAARAIGFAFWLNFSFAIIEFIGGRWAGSTAIMANAVHDFGDSLAIGFGWGMSRLAGRRASETFSYGFGRLSLFGALVNGLILVVGSAWVLWQAVPRLGAPVMPHAPGMVALAVLGVTVNGVAAWRLAGGTTLGAALLVVDWPILDPLLSIALTGLILFNVARNLATTGRLFFQASPDAALVREVTAKLRAVEHVVDLHHLHLWSLDGERHVLTVHLDIDEPITNAVQHRIKEAVAAALVPYRFAHTTIEIEQAEEPCRDTQAF